MKRANKWEQFKQKRAIAIDKYIKVKRKHFLIKQFYILIETRKAVKRLSAQFKKACHINEMKIRGKFMNIVIAYRWRNRRRKFGSSLDQVINRNLRKDLTWRGFIMNVTYEQRAIEFLKPFMERQ